MRTVLMLLGSNIFMTVAWYGHLRFKQAPLFQVIVISWMIAFFEYCLQVPANRWGHETFSAPQLKIMQEVITLGVFVGFSIFWLKEMPRWNQWVAMLLIFSAVLVGFWPSLNR